MVRQSRDALVHHRSGNMSWTGILAHDAAISHHLNPLKKPRLNRHSSSSDLVSNANKPSLRLVSRHPHLSAELEFMRVPEIHDGYRRRFFFARKSTVQIIIAAICDELGLTKASPVRGGGEIDYQLEHVRKTVTGERDSHFLSSLTRL